MLLLRLPCRAGRHPALGVHAAQPGWVWVSSHALVAHASGCCREGEGPVTLDDLGGCALAHARWLHTRVCCCRECERLVMLHASDGCKTAQHAWMYSGHSGGCSSRRCYGAVPVPCPILASCECGSSYCSCGHGCLLAWGLMMFGWRPNLTQIHAPGGNVTAVQSAVNCTLSCLPLLWFFSSYKFQDRFPLA